MMTRTHKFGGTGSERPEMELAERFFDMVKVEPRLLTLAKRIDDAMSQRPIDFIKDSNLWYGYGGGHAFKSEMNRIVGFDAEVKALRNMDSHGIACDFLYYYLIEERKYRKMTLAELTEQFGGAV